MVFRQVICAGALAVAALGVTSCTNKHVSNPIANVESKQPDKVLFDRAMDALKHNRFDVARITLQTLINTYPDSEYVARAKLAIGDSWYAEGTTAAYAQAESEYKDFITFFPNMPEAAEAQLKVANIHYKQMEKADRDYTHAKRAEEEYRSLIQQFPDSKLVPEAKARLMEVQEVLAEREFQIGRFYYLRQSYPAAIARLKSMADAYPLYSGADEALFMLGSAYEAEAAAIRSTKLPEATKAKLIDGFTNHAVESYNRILTRYPVMGTADEAKKRLEALHRPVPKATDQAIAQNKQEEESRGKNSAFGSMMLNFHRQPDMSRAAKAGEPTLVDPKETSAPEIVKATGEAILRGGGFATTNSVSVETIKPGEAPPPNQPVPRSDASAGTASDAAAGSAAAGSADTSNEVPELKNDIQPDVSTPAAGDTSSSTGGASSAPAPAPAQVNEAQEESPAPAAQAQGGKDSTSAKKKKTGLHKLVPF